ncbi:MAG TPA: response regulator [Anaeromyxobacter sp.]|nr:response regulator [Anaeromyxobacter sp.]
MADERAEGKQRSRPVEASELAGRRVLVVDDDGGVRAVLSRMLQAFGVEVETAPGGAQAMARIDREAYDALLLDLDMPGVTGLDVLLHVQRAAPRMPVLVVTGTFEAERIEGAVAVIAKPVDPPSLKTALAEAIRATPKKE